MPLHNDGRVVSFASAVIAPTASVDSASPPVTFAEEQPVRAHQSTATRIPPRGTAPAAPAQCHAACVASGPVVSPRLFGLVSPSSASPYRAYRFLVAYCLHGSALAALQGAERRTRSSVAAVMSDSVAVWPVFRLGRTS